MLEAMACGTPVMATTAGAIPDIIKDGENGFLVPVGDHEKLADGIVYLLMNKEMRDKFGKAGRKLIMERAEYQREMGNMERIYQKLLKK